MDGEPWLVVPLSEPIQAHGEELSELPLKKPTVKQLKGIRAYSPDGIDIGEHVARILSELGQIPRSAAEKIPLEDLFEAMDKFADFTDRFR